MDYLPQSRFSKLAPFYGNYQSRKGDYSYQTLNIFPYFQSISFDTVTLFNYLLFKRNLRYKPLRLPFLNIGQPLVKKLAASLSASILFIVWLMYLVPNHRDVLVLGFQKKLIKKYFTHLIITINLLNNIIGKAKISFWKNGDKEGLHFKNGYEKGIS